MGVYTNLWNNMSMWMTMGIREFHGFLWNFGNIHECSCMLRKFDSEK